MEGLRRAPLIDPFESVSQNESERRDFDKAPGAPLRPKQQNRNFALNDPKPTRGLSEIHTNRLNERGGVPPPTTTPQFPHFATNWNNNAPEFTHNPQPNRIPLFDQNEQNAQQLQLLLQLQQLQQLKLENQRNRNCGQFIGQNQRLPHNPLFGQNLNMLQNAYQFAGIPEQVRKPQPLQFINPKIPMHMPYQVKINKTKN